MSWLFSRVLVEEYLGEISSDGEQYALSSGNHTPQVFLPPDKTTRFWNLSRYGMTCRPLMDGLWPEVLTWCQEGFPARTSAQQESEPESMDSDQECGSTWRAWLAKYDQHSCSWRTPQRSLFEDSEPCLETWPKWGLMLRGVCYQQPTSALHTCENESGLWPGTPTKAMSERSEDFKTPGLTPAEFVRTLPGGGQLNPAWVEWLMGWPIGHTDLQPLAMDRWQEWQRVHSHCWPAA